MASEKWAHVNEYYRISSFGRVRTLCGRGPKMLKPWADGCGYLQVSLKGLGDKKIARLVMEAFVGKSSLQINHIDGVKANNRLENLEYVTPSQNICHAFEIGLRTSLGVAHNGTFLKDDDIGFIRDIYSARAMNQRQLGALFGLHFSTINKITRRKNWSHI